MPKAICALSLLKCSCGTVPTPFMVLPKWCDHDRLSCWKCARQCSFSKYNSLWNVYNFSANPTVAAAGGSPMPCIPVTLFPWSDTATKVKIKGIPSVTQESKLQCLWTGSISIEAPSQFIVDKE